MFGQHCSRWTSIKTMLIQRPLVVIHVCYVTLRTNLTHICYNTINILLVLVVSIAGSLKPY